jgi:hypothetical protein
MPFPREETTPPVTKTYLVFIPPPDFRKQCFNHNYKRCLLKAKTRLCLPALPDFDVGNPTKGAKDLKAAGWAGFD